MQTEVPGVQVGSGGARICGEALVLVTQLTAIDSVLEKSQARAVEKQISSGTVRLHRDKVRQYTHVGFCQLGSTNAPLNLYGYICCS